MNKQYESIEAIVEEKLQDFLKRRRYYQGLNPDEVETVDLDEKALDQLRNSIRSRLTDTSIVVVGDYKKTDNLQEVVLSFMKEHDIKEEGSLFMNRGAVFIDGDLKVLYVKDREINHFAIRYTPKKGA